MSSKFTALAAQVHGRSVSRRQFGQGAAALGLGAAAAATISPAVFAQDASPAASDIVAIPDFGTENQTRGEAGELRIIQSQAPTVLAAHSSTGSKDTFAGSLVMEPLFGYDLSGELGGRLAASVPSVEDGTLAEDLTSVTITLKEGILWSDGEPVTADDVRFTWQWVTTESNASVNAGVWGVISDIEVVDDLTVNVTFSTPQVAWFEPFTGVDSGIIYPSHVFGDDPANKNDAFLSAPIGTGPFKVDSFSPNDAATFSANENYREPNKPAFATVVFKGGGDALSAGRAVVQTGDYDYAWNVQAEPEVIAELEANGTAGKILLAVGTTVEGLYINFSDPNTEVDGQLSEKNTPNPVFSDKAVRDALNVAINRELIAGQFYGGAEYAESNALTGFEYFTSPNTSWTFDLEEAARILDEAGWALDGDVRSKDGVELAISFASPINQVRQKTQQVIKADLESIGFKVELVQIDTGIFFDSAAGNDQNSAHFFWDLAMWSSGPPSAIPVAFLDKWYAGPDGENIAQASNGWSKANYQRWQDAEYDSLYDQLLEANTLEAAQELLIALNDRVIQEVAFVPMVRRPFFNAASNRLREENIAGGAVFTSPYWNIANWNLVEE